MPRKPLRDRPLTNTERQARRRAARAASRPLNHYQPAPTDTAALSAVWWFFQIGFVECWLHRAPETRRVKRPCVAVCAWVSFSQERESCLDGGRDACLGTYQHNQPVHPRTDIGNSGRLLFLLAWSKIGKGAAEKRSEKRRHRRPKSRYRPAKRGHCQPKPQ